MKGSVCESRQWEVLGVIAARLHASGWSYGISSQRRESGELLYCVDAHQDGRRFIVQSDELLTGGFSLRSKVDVRITSKFVATTAHGKSRDRGAIEQTKIHENLHRDVAKKWHDANQNKVPKGPFKTPEAATKAAQEAGDKIRADFNRTLDIDKQHKPDSLWKKILEKDR